MGQEKNKLSTNADSEVDIKTKYNDRLYNGQSYQSISSSRQLYNLEILIFGTKLEIEERRIPAL